MERRASTTESDGGALPSTSRPTSARPVNLTTKHKLTLKLPKKKTTGAGGLDDSSPKASVKFDDTGLPMAATATRDEIMHAIDGATADVTAQEDRQALESQQRSLYRVSTIVKRTSMIANGPADEMDINLNRANEVLRGLEDRTEILDEFVIDLTHEEVEEKHASNVGFVKLERGGVITKKDMQQYKRMYHEIESFSRRGTITLPAFRRYLQASCPALVSESDRVSNTSMYHKLTRGAKEHFSLMDFMHFMYPKATKREVELACSMVGEKVDRPHVQIAAVAVREIAEIFKFWNVSGTGEIGWDELRGHLNTMMSPLQVEEMLADAKKYDDDRSQGLSFREFMFWWTAGGTEIDVSTLEEKRRQFSKARDPVHVLNSYIEAHSKGSVYQNMQSSEDIRMMERVRQYLAQKRAEEEAERERERERERAKLRELELRKRLKEELDRQTAEMQRRAEEMAALGLMPDGTPMPAGGADGGLGVLSVEARLKAMLQKAEGLEGGASAGAVQHDFLALMNQVNEVTGTQGPPPRTSVDEPTVRADPSERNLAALRGVMRSHSRQVLASLKRASASGSFSFHGASDRPVGLSQEGSWERTLLDQESGWATGAGASTMASSKTSASGALTAGGRQTSRRNLLNSAGFSTRSGLQRTTSNLGLSRGSTADGTGGGRTSRLEVGGNTTQELHTIEDFEDH